VSFLGRFDEAFLRERSLCISLDALFLFSSSSSSSSSSRFWLGEAFVMNRMGNSLLIVIVSGVNYNLVLIFFNDM
jgi:hypothetical protein